MSSTFRKCLIVPAKAPGKCLHVDLSSGEGRENGTFAHLWDMSPGEYLPQEWYFDGKLIRSALWPGKCLHIENFGKTNGTVVHLWDIAPHSFLPQEWVMEGENIVSKFVENMCIHQNRSDGGNGVTQNGTKIHLWDKKDHNNARWTLQWLDNNPPQPTPSVESFLGDTFDFPPNASGVKQVLVNANSFTICGIQFCYRDGRATPWVGGKQGDESAFDLDEDDEIVKIIVGSKERVRSIQFETKRGYRSPKYGEASTTIHQVIHESNMFMNGERLGSLCGFTGSCASNQDIKHMNFKWDVYPQFHRCMMLVDEMTDKIEELTTRFKNIDQS